ncbi:hypothetical protein FVF58_08220 [Paraburkholderia panacisoli]|jgi:mono/diheme cytochrome c family protein|uniref:Uncharacterized protein n=1 Tax=Paraburkholderia panacisoli TaxID=2603818 RepID=A0A5B0HF55_9BURK|nr:hypothetical protein [Paraburkholderia panacisoli]KAA1013717.1 hypothetical protein FVF58_08220 [Paraburkholderia panacisoli]
MANSPKGLGQVILHGVRCTTKGSDVGVPAFATQLNDAQTAALTHCVTTQFGNPSAARVTNKGVAKLR